jgi:hypothetical protein
MTRKILIKINAHLTFEICSFIHYEIFMYFPKKSQYRACQKVHRHVLYMFMYFEKSENYDIENGWR